MKSPFGGKQEEPPASSALYPDMRGKGDDEDSVDFAKRGHKAHQQQQPYTYGQPVQTNNGYPGAGPSYAAGHPTAPPYPDGAAYGYYNSPSHPSSPNQLYQHQPAMYVGQGVPIGAAPLPQNVVTQGDEDEAVNILMWLLAGGVCCCNWMCCLGGAIYGQCCTRAKHRDRVKKWTLIHWILTFIVMGLWAGAIALIIIYAAPFKWEPTGQHKTKHCADGWDIGYVFHASPIIHSPKRSVYFVGNSDAKTTSNQFSSDIDYFAKTTNDAWDTYVLDPPGFGTTRSSKWAAGTTSTLGSTPTISEEQKDEYYMEFMETVATCFGIPSSAQVAATIRGDDDSPSNRKNVLVAYQNGMDYVLPYMFTNERFDAWIGWLPALDRFPTDATRINPNTLLLLHEGSNRDVDWLTRHFTNHRFWRKTGRKDELRDAIQDVYGGILFWGTTRDFFNV